MNISCLKIRFSLIIGLIIFFTSFTVNATHVLYSIEYADSSVKGPSLENAKVRGQLFRSGNPAGFIQFKTDSNKQFRIDNDKGSYMSLAIFSIEGQKKLNLLCDGNANLENHKIVVQCHR